jgi:hypothetical protein
MKHQFIEKYCNEYLCRNVWFIEKFASAVQRIKPKDTDFSEITSLLGMVKCKSGAGVASVTSFASPPDISYMEALISNLGEKTNPRLDCIVDKVTSDMYKLLNILLYKTIKHDKRDVENILSYLFSMRQLSLDDITYPEMSSIKTGKNDIVWYLWKILLAYAEEVEDEIVSRFIKSNLAIFSCAYQKKQRSIRIHILYHVFKSVCRSSPFYVKELCVAKPEIKEFDYLSFLPLKNMMD